MPSEKPHQQAVVDEKKELDERIGRCGRCSNPSPGLHECPYAAEIGGDKNPEYCNCCSNCETECCSDI